MANIQIKNFPGVYSQISDQSLAPTSTSRFQPGLIGVASMGPFDTPTPIATTGDFINTFGQPIPGYFLGTALGIIAPFTNGATVVRVGAQYQPLPGNTPYPATGASGNGYFVCQATPLLNPNISPTGSVFVQITQPGKLSTVNAQVSSINGIYGSLNGATLSDTYTNGVVEFSYYENAASNAESKLYGYVTQTVNLGIVSGIKGQYFFNCTATPSNLNTGDLLIITQGTNAPTQEVYVSVANPIVGSSAVIQLQQTPDQQRGYQPLPLQDNYTAATVSRVVGKTPAAIVTALTAGTWANTQTSSPVGLQVQVAPGTNPGTKKILVYWNSSLVEVFDNLGEFTIPTGANDIDTTINTTTPSNYITIQMLGTVIPANTVNPTNLYASNSILGAPTNAAQYPPEGGAFSGGFDGEQAQAADFVGYYDPTNDVSTGIQAFEDTDGVFINALYAPGVTSTDGSTVSVHSQIRDTCKATNAIGIIDIPAVNPMTFPPNGEAGVPLNIWNAIDWANGVGQFLERGLFNTYYLACYFNWFTMQDPITQQTILAPPGIGALRAMAFTWLNYQPWYAAAGVNHGVIQEATAVSFPKISSDAKEAAYVAGQNPINIILQSGGDIMVYGELTMLRTPIGTTDKLTAVHNLVLVEYVVQGLTAIGKTHVFDPNDQSLLAQINSEMNQFLAGVQNLRGIEAYQLICDTSNNTAATRNLREVIVDLFIVPTDSVEKIYVNATVLSSGAIVNAING
jgi:hypothetical protein